MKYTLVCSASGTGLSKSMERLVERIASGLRVEDVEANLCRDSELWDLPAFGGVAGNSRSMKHVCSKLPRSAVSKYWRKALSSSLRTLKEAGAADESSLALACHLTLFTPHRQEFFVPGRPDDFLKHGESVKYEVSRVVVLIDDIYDMYARLSDSDGIFNESQQMQNYNDYTEKLSGKSLLDPETGSPELLRFEVRRRSLESLAAWRRAELVQAEALAAALGDVPLCVLGVKNHLSALEALVLRPSTSVVYLSHKITEARRFNRENDSWPPFVDEINALSARFRDRGVVLLQPTAIDELRTASSEHKIGLTSRWPLQKEGTEDLIYTRPEDTDAPEYYALLGSYDFEQEGTENEAIAVFRGLELAIWSEIATRDHLLVSSTDGLVLYRPVVENGKGSSGARAEVVHWQQRWAHESEKPRLVAMHTFEDISLRLELLKPDHRVALRLTILEVLRRQGLEHDSASDLLDGKPPTSKHLQAVSGGEDFHQELENAAGVALTQNFLGWLCHIHLPEGREGATLVAAASAEELRSRSVLEMVVGLLAGKSDPIPTTARHIVKYSEAQGHENLTSFARHLIVPDDSHE